MTLSSVIVAQAVVCSKAPDGVHHFGHVEQPMGYSVYKGTHEYLFGYDPDGRPIYHNDCKIYDAYSYCRNLYSYCQTGDGSSDHAHYKYTYHTVSHSSFLGGIDNEEVMFEDYNIGCFTLSMRL